MLERVESTKLSSSTPIVDDVKPENDDDILNKNDGYYVYKPMLVT